MNRGGGASSARCQRGIERLAHLCLPEVAHDEHQTRAPVLARPGRQAQYRVEHVLHDVDHARRRLTDARLANGVGATVEASVGFNATASAASLVYQNLLEARRFRLAVQFYQRFLQEVPGSPAAAEVTRRLEAARAQVRALSVRGAIASVPSGLAAKVVSRAGEETCTTPCEVWVDPGPVSVEVARGAQVARERWSWLLR